MHFDHIDVEKPPVEDCECAHKSKCQVNADNSRIFFAYIPIVKPKPVTIIIIVKDVSNYISEESNGWVQYGVNTNPTYQLVVDSGEATTGLFAYIGNKEQSYEGEGIH